MSLRRAGEQDLPRLKTAYQTVIERMQREGIFIWNERYPYEVLGEDISLGRLYLMETEGEIEAIFALCAESGGERFVQWKYSGKALYLYRLGVSGAPRSGVGGKALCEAMKLARAFGASSLRLFVVDNNVPALRFYQKHGFEKVPGIYEDSVADGPLLSEYGFEKKL